MVDETTDLFDPIFLSISRRRFLRESVLATTVFSVSGCSTAWHIDAISIKNCDEISDPWDRSACRQKALRAEATQYMSVGIMVGAALGAASAPLLKVNPLAAIIVGAVAGGLIAAADAYIEYRLNEANRDLQAALDGIRHDIRIDGERAKSTLDDAKEVTTAVSTIAKNARQSLYKTSLTLDKIESVVKEININAKTYRQASGIYEAVCERTALKGDKNARTGVSQISAIADQVREEQSKAALEFYRTR